MGLIALLYIGAFLSAIVLVIFIYVFLTKKIFTVNISRASKIVLMITLMPVLIVPLYYLFSSYKNDMIYVRGFFSIAPKTSQSIELDTGNGKLNFIIELDFNTGARGGAFIKNSIFYFKNEKKKEILVTENEIRMNNSYRFNKKASSKKIISDEVEQHKGYGKYYYDLYFSSKLFSIEEFEKISDFLKKNHILLSKKINDYKKNQKSEVFNQTRFRNAFYQDFGED